MTWSADCTEECRAECTVECAAECTVECTVECTGVCAAECTAECTGECTGECTVECTVDCTAESNGLDGPCVISSSALNIFFNISFLINIFVSATLQDCFWKIYCRNCKQCQPLKRTFSPQY